MHSLRHPGPRLCQAIMLPRLKTVGCAHSSESKPDTYLRNGKDDRTIGRSDRCGQAGDICRLDE